MAATPGEDINWLEDIALLEEDGVPGGLRPLLERLPEDLLPDPRGPRGRDRPQGADEAPDESGNSYGIQLKADHTKFPQPELGPWVEGSRTVGTDYTPPVLEGCGEASRALTPSACRRSGVLRVQWPFVEKCM